MVDRSTVSVSSGLTSSPIETLQACSSLVASCLIMSGPSDASHHDSDSEESMALGYDQHSENEGTETAAGEERRSDRVSVAPKTFTPSSDAPGVGTASRELVSFAKLWQKDS